MTSEQVQTIGFIVALVIAPLVGWPVWLAILAVKRHFDQADENEIFTPMTPEEYTGSLIETFGQAGYEVASRLEELSKKGN